MAWSRPAGWPTTTRGVFFAPTIIFFALSVRLPGLRACRESYWQTPGAQGGRDRMGMSADPQASALLVQKVAPAKAPARAEGRPRARPRRERSNLFKRFAALMGVSLMAGHRACRPVDRVQAIPSRRRSFSATLIAGVIGTDGPVLQIGGSRTERALAYSATASADQAENVESWLTSRARACQFCLRTVGTEGFR